MCMYVSLSMYSKWYRLMAIKSSHYRLLYTDEHVHVYVYIYCIMIFLLLYTVQDDLLAREIFGEFVSEIQLADFMLAILL